MNNNTLKVSIIIFLDYLMDKRRSFWTVYCDPEPTSNGTRIRSGSIVL